MLIAVFKSWEVIAVTIAIVLYLFLVFYVARLNRPRRAPGGRKMKAPKAAKNAAPEPAEVEVTDEE